MSAASHQRAKRTKTSRWVTRVLRVGTADLFVGDILLDQNLRVRGHATSVPSDIVLKVLVANTRQGETCGKLTGRDGLEYFWSLIDAAKELSEETRQETQSDFSREFQVEETLQTVCA